jgi:hypothetical protein
VLAEARRILWETAADAKLKLKRVPAVTSVMVAAVLAVLALL